MQLRYRITTCLVWIVLLPGQISVAQDSKDLVSEEALDYYQKWLDEDVVHIISEDERAVFEKLTTFEEKEQFIEQFWFRRDPNPATADNEFKLEHYRRIAYANERFASGFPGWMTDRGRIYIIHGPPAEIESHAAGGAYQRPFNEGGGSTSTYPFEIWRYRHIEGVGDDIVLEFVDRSLSGEYRLALQPEEKDALLYVPGAGLTLPEQQGLVSKADRPYFNPASRGAYPGSTHSHRDNPFYRYEVYTNIQAAPIVKYRDLKELVQVNVEFSNLPFLVKEAFFRLNQDQILVPITLQLENKDLTFERDGNQHIARVGVYGVVSSIANRLVTEFEDDLVASYSAEQLESGLTESSIYQRIVPLEARMRYKLDLVVKDLNTGKIGAIRRAILPPKFNEQLSASTLVVANKMEVLETTPEPDEMFVLGDVKIRPNLNRRFTPERPFGVYFHLYNVALDQTTLAPSLEVAYRISREGRFLRGTVDEEGESMQFFSGQRVVIMKQLSCRGLEPGKYVIEVEARDRLTDQKVTLSTEFTLIGSDQLAFQ
jgi:GWxTD domain-containing protein